MTIEKRILDLLIAICLTVTLGPVIIVICLVILVLDGRPIFYVSERMKSAETGFSLVKFRTMKPDANDSGASGGHKANRITKSGAFLRAKRLDELPQLWNVLKGDISFVGPRPPLRQYVEQFPEIYTQVLVSRPGITGLASLIFHRHEEWLLRNCKTTPETEEIYCRACIPQKAKLDLIYQDNRSVCFDILLMLKTVFRRIPLN